MKTSVVLSFEIVNGGSLLLLDDVFLTIVDGELIDQSSTISISQVCNGVTQIRADSSLAPCQWETSLQSNAVFHWLSANQDSARKNDDLSKEIEYSSK